LDQQNRVSWISFLNITSFVVHCGNLSLAWLGQWNRPWIDCLLWWYTDYWGNWLRCSV